MQANSDSTNYYASEEYFLLTYRMYRMWSDKHPHQLPAHIAHRMALEKAVQHVEAILR